MGKEEADRRGETPHQVFITGKPMFFPHSTPQGDTKGDPPTHMTLVQSEGSLPY